MGPNNSQQQMVSSSPDPRKGEISRHRNQELAAFPHFTCCSGSWQGIADLPCPQPYSPLPTAEKSRATQTSSQVASVQVLQVAETKMELGE